MDQNPQDSNQPPPSTARIANDVENLLREITPDGNITLGSLLNTVYRHTNIRNPANNEQELPVTASDMNSSDNLNPFGPLPNAAQNNSVGPRYRPHEHVIDINGPALVESHTQQRSDNTIPHLHPTRNDNTVSLDSPPQNNQTNNNNDQNQTAAEILRNSPELRQLLEHLSGLCKYIPILLILLVKFIHEFLMSKYYFYRIKILIHFFIRRPYHL